MSSNKSYGKVILDPILRHSTSAPSGVAADQAHVEGKKKDWNSRIPVKESLPNYDAVNDPYCPYTHTANFKKKYEQQIKLAKLNSKQGLSKSQAFLPTVESSMKGMERPKSSNVDKVFRHEVRNDNGGVTYSTEPNGNAREGQAELEVLRTILNREAYLDRLYKAVRKIEKKFKVEIADIMDLVRVATLDVIGAIDSWRQVKNDFTCVYIWNGINYLLKIPSDLDYLQEYKAIANWLGFSIIRNPFCIPYPMELGNHMFSNSAAPSHQSKDTSNSLNDGYIVGGVIRPSNKLHFKDSYKHEKQMLGSPYKSQLVPQTVKTTGQVRGKTEKAQIHTFVSNDDMSLIRNAEKILMNEEKRFGRYDRDIGGRLIPAEQAYMSHLSKNLDADCKRDIKEKSRSKPQFAPHSALSGIGFEELPWFPEKGKAEINDPTKFGEDETKQITNIQDKKGGALAPVSFLKTNTVMRKPLAVNTGNEIEFKSWRKRKSLAERLNEITELKSKIAAERQLLKSEPMTIEKKKDMGDDLRHELLVEVVRAFGKSEEEENLDAEQTKATNKYEAIMHGKTMNRQIDVKERSRDVERKRRQLTEEEAKRKGPPEDEEKTAYDAYAVVIQTQLRRWLAQRWLAWYKLESYRASRLIQAKVRKWEAKNRVKRLMKQKKAAIMIQKNWRGTFTRMSCAAMARDYKEGKAAVIIQKTWRRILGVRRVAAKRALDKAALESMECVNARNLFPMDVKEFAKRVEVALYQPGNVALPPDEVLHLLRMSCTLLVAADGHVGITTYNNVGARYYDEYTEKDISWEEGMKIVNRSNKFLRRIRALAYAPVAKPPRLVHVPPQVHTLYRAQLKNSQWCLETFETMGQGSKFCTQLFKWLKCLIELSDAQTKFMQYIGDKFPDWLPKLTEIQKSSRRLEFDIAINERCSGVMQSIMDSYPDDANLQFVVGKEKDDLLKEIKIFQVKLKGFQEREASLGQDQTTLENMALLQMTDKLKEVETRARNLLAEYDELLKLTQSGDSLAESRLPDCREKLINCQVELKEQRIQQRLLVTQCENNKHRRKEKAPLTVEVKKAISICGEAKAIYLFSKCKKEILLLSQNIKSEDALHLHPKVVPVYQDLVFTEKEKKEEFRRSLRSAEVELSEMNHSILSEYTQREEQEKKERALFIPTEAEMEEERLEDDHEAKAERFSRIQYVSSEVLFDCPKRERPVIVAVGRDVPHFSKVKVLSELVSMLPGNFVQLDIEKNMGLCLNSMQSILDAGKNIIIMVDYGMTKITRSTFIKNYNLICKSLVPQPYSIFVVGDDENKRMPEGSTIYGVSNSDLIQMRDSDIKISLETMAYAIHQLLTPEIKRKIEQRTTLVVPPTPSFILVLEAVYIIQANHSRFQMPDNNISGVSWRTTQGLLQDTHTLVSQLKAVKRGRADSRLCEILRNYVTHRHWPHNCSNERIADPLMHLLSLYVENFLRAEQLTLERGGPPESSMLKSELDRLQAVVMITDSDDGHDVINSNKRSGWKVPLTQILKSVLFELRTLKTVRKIEGDMYSINVYRDSDRIFFDAYDANTSQSYMVCIKVTDIPQLLVPYSMAAINSTSPPPKTPKEMYTRLCALLRFQKVSKQKNGKKEMLCKRENTFLEQSVKCIDGHVAIIKSYEAALGDLYLEAYLPHYSAQLNLLIDDALRLKLLENCDPLLEYHIVETSKGTDLLPYVLDRLRITPRRAFEGTRLVTTRQQSPLILQHAGQGFSLKLNCNGGPGKLLSSKVITICNITLLLRIRVSSVSKTLRLSFYDRVHQQTHEQRISLFQRQVLIGATDDNIKSWYHKLVNRIKIAWRRNKFELFVDNTIFRKVKKIGTRNVIMTFFLIDEESLKVTLFNIATSLNFEAILTKKNIVELLSYSVEDDENSANGNQAEEVDKSFVQSIKNMLRFMLNRRSKQLESNKTTVAAVTNYLDFTMVDILTNDACISLLSYRLQKVLVIPDSDVAEFSINVPIEISFVKVIKDTTIPLDVQMRHPETKVKLRDGSLEDVIYGRRQATPVIMESALNELAHSKAEKARLQAISDKQAAEELSRSLMASTAEADVDEPNDDTIGIEQVLAKSSSIAAASIIDSISNMLESKDNERQLERENPGSLPRKEIPVYHKPEPSIRELSTRDLVLGEEKLVFNRGVKVTFKEGRSRWHGHVNIAVYFSVCWDGPEGMGRKYRFHVYEPVVSNYFDGLIKSTKHMKEVLGKHGQDLVPEEKVTEMLLFVCRNRLLMVRNTTTWDGEPITDPDAPAYRVEFVTDVLYNVAKVTPINASGQADEESNADKLIDEGKTRGRKILRVARRVSGLLLQLVVFEMPKDKKQKSEIQQDIKEKGSDIKKDGPKNLVTSKHHRAKLEMHEAPTLRVLGYDPRSKQRSIVVCPPQAVLEIAGGAYSAYLEESRRRELARIVCEALQLIYPKGGGFELLVPWAQTAEIVVAGYGGGKKSWRMSSERVLQRPGKIFRSGVRISNLDLIVSVYLYVSRREGDGDESAANKTKIDRSVVFNFYAQVASETTEIVLTEAVQIEYMGRCVQNFIQGDARATAIRNMCKFFSAEIEEDPNDSTKKVLNVELMPKNKGYIVDYKEIGLPKPGEDQRATGVPSVFMPPDTAGALLYRLNTKLFVKQSNATSDIEFLVSVFSKTKLEGPERGLVVKVYDPTISMTNVLHYSPSEVARLAKSSKDHDGETLLRELVSIKERIVDEDFSRDRLEENFSLLTEKGESVEQLEKLTLALCKLAVEDIGITLNSQGERTLYSLSSAYEPL